MSNITRLLPQVHGQYTPTPRKKPSRPRTKGYKVTSPRTHKDMVLTPQQVLEARWLHEFAHWRPRDIAAHYQINYQYMWRVLVYEFRGKHSHPTKDSFAAGHQPSPATTPPYAPVR